MSHAKLSASGSHRWINCPGSVAAEDGLPGIPSPYAEEGTAAHALAAAMLLAKELPAADAEMLEAVEQYVAVVNAARAEAGEGAYFSVERKFSLKRLRPPADMFGTSDAVLFAPSRRRLSVYDLKYGQGVLVEVEGNPQPMYYALGALLEFEERHPEYRVEEIELVIVQPRAFHPDGAVRRVVLTYEDLVAFTIDLLAAAGRALDPQAPRIPGDWCRFCKAAGSCPELAAQATAVAQVEFAAMPVDMPPSPATLPVEMIGHVLDNADILEDWLRAVRARAQNILESGGEVPGWKLVPKRATRKWVNEPAAVEYARAKGMKDIDIFETSVRSVAQIEQGLKRVKRGAKVPGELFKKESSGNTLAPDADPRPAVPAISAADAFAALPAGSSGAHDNAQIAMRTEEHHAP